MGKLIFSVLLSLILCAACETQTKLPYPTGAVRKLNLDKRPVNPRVEVPSAPPAASAPRYNGEYGNGLGH